MSWYLPVFHIWTNNQRVIDLFDREELDAIQNSLLNQQDSVLCFPIKNHGELKVF